MGRTVLRAVYDAPDMELASAWDPHAAGSDLGELAGLGRTGLQASATAAEALACSPDVVIDFTVAASAGPNAREALSAGASPVIGTTGLGEQELSQIDELARSRGLGCFLAPNFATGAVLMMLFARQAARHFPEVEIIEYHGPQKVDAPSGTAMRTLEFIREGRGAGRVERPAKEHELLPGARGGDCEGIRLHSVRLPGSVAHQDVIFGGEGQRLTIRHDSIDRQSFMPGVLLAVRRVRDLRGLVVGLERLLEL